ncbi:MAG: hypothetical protein Kow00122_08000 [Thermoleophilia bacterium]
MRVQTPGEAPYLPLPGSFPAPWTPPRTPPRMGGGRKVFPRTPGASPAAPAAERPAPLSGDGPAYALQHPLMGPSPPVFAAHLHPTQRQRGSWQAWFR